MAFDWGNLISAVVPSLIKGGADYLGSSYADDNRQQEQAYLDRKLAQEAAISEKELATRLAIAQLQAGSAGAGSGAAVAAARIKAATDEKAIKQQALQALLEGRLKQADLANPEVVNSAGQFKADQSRQTGQTGLQAFMGLADRLQSPLLRR